MQSNVLIKMGGLRPHNASVHIGIALYTAIKWTSLALLCLSHTLYGNSGLALALDQLAWSAACCYFARTKPRWGAGQQAEGLLVQL